MRPPNTHDRDYSSALRMAEEAEKRADWYPVKDYFHGIRDQWLERACELDPTTKPRSAE